MLEPRRETHIQKASLEALEGKMLELPQVECPVVHHFGPGIYIREVSMPAGSLALGHAQKFEHLNILLKGAVAMLDDEGEVIELRAPMIFTGKPGRKFGYIIEDTVWQNVYATDETDVDILEETYLDKDYTWQINNEEALRLESAARQEDRDDFFKVIALAGFPPEVVRAQSENEEDQMTIPSRLAPKLTIRNSVIEGEGVFVSSAVEEGEIISPARLNGMRTPAGRYTNHSKNPNAIFVKSDSGNVYLIAKKRIAGCVGGSQGEEVTVDYRQALSLAGVFIDG